MGTSNIGTIFRVTSDVNNISLYGDPGGLPRVGYPDRIHCPQNCVQRKRTVAIGSFSISCGGAFPQMGRSMARFVPVGIDSIRCCGVVPAYRPGGAVYLRFLLRVLAGRPFRREQEGVWNAAWR